MIFLSLICMLAGPGLYLALSFVGIYRLYPIESYVLMAVAIWLAWWAARRKGGWWHYGVCGLNSVMLAMFIYWTMSLSQLPEVKLPVAVGKPFISITLSDHNGSTFDSENLVGKSAALYLFYRGDW
jgi:ABC-type dipeptide/oligopeptide/nickel transport system permease component